MADETETGRTEPQIENTNDIRKWLEKARPAADVCVALAARAALRALPLILWDQLGSPVQKADAKKKETLRHFRSMAASLITAKYPGSVANLSDDMYVLNQPFLDVDPPLNDFFAYYISNAVSSAESVAIDLHDELSSNPFPSYSRIHRWIIETVDYATAGINYAATNSQRIIDEHKVIPSDHEPNSFKFRGKIIQPDDLDPEAKKSETAYWEAIQRDFKLILSGTWANVLAEKPLWHGKPPILIINYWRSLKDFLPDSDNWWVWKNWYEDILNGKDHGGAHDLIYATVPIWEWDKGPAATNKWIAERLAELGENPSSSDINLDDFPKPLDNIPSLFTFGLNDADQIDVVAGPQNTPVIGFAGDEKTHRQWLETARELARRLAVDLRDDKFGNVRRDYADGLVRYAGDLPIEIGEGNFLLADHEIIAIHDLFGAEAAILPESLGARLNRVLKAHYSLLDFYPETKRYHEAAQKGRLSPPAPEEAFAGFEKVVREFTPEIFAPRVTREIEAASYEAPRVEIDEEDRKLHAAIGPAPYPFENDSLKEQRYGKASTCNAILKAVNNPERINAYWDLGIKLKPYWEQIEPFLASLLN